jgi:hypothetical protein
MDISAEEISTFAALYPHDVRPPAAAQQTRREESQ